MPAGGDDLIGPRYWSTGIVVWLDSRGLWQASLDFLDDGFGQEQSTEGSMRCRYAHRSLAHQLDLLIADAGRMGIWFRDPTLYYQGDGEDPEFVPPGDWSAVRSREIARLGWQL